MARRREYLFVKAGVPDENGEVPDIVAGLKDGFKLTFEELTTGQEDTYEGWLKGRYAEDCYKMFRGASQQERDRALAQCLNTYGVGGCSLLGGHGITACTQGEGAIQFLKLAAQANHPDMSEDALRHLLRSQHDDCMKVIHHLHPFPEMKKQYRLLHLARLKMERDIAEKEKELSIGIDLPK